MKDIKYIFNYNLEECNRLFKHGMMPVGCGLNKKTNTVYHVFFPTKKYFDILEIVKCEVAKITEVQNLGK